MNNTRNVFAFLIVMFMVMGSYPITMSGTMNVDVSIVNNSALSLTNIVVENVTRNVNQEFNDDDIEFTVYNYTQPITQANVTLWNQTDDTKYDSKLTVGNGIAVFYDVPQGIYKWNITWPLAPDEVATGYHTSDGPEVFVTTKTGNLDWDNDDDDFNATVIDIDGNPAEGLNFTLAIFNTTTIYDQVVIPADGKVSFYDVPEENYTWYISPLSGTYENVTIASGNWTSDGTTLLVKSNIGPITGSSDFYDLEVFTYYETSLAPLSSALVNVTFYNGTEYKSKITSSNGTVRFVDLPVEYINWTVSYLNEQIGAGSLNLTAPSADIRSPIISSPSSVEYLEDETNMTITWNISDAYPNLLRVYVDGSINTTIDWTNQTSYTFNATGTALGSYEIKLDAEDQNGNVAENVVDLRIYEDVLPVVFGPSDVEYILSETGNTLRWNISEDNPSMYTLKLDEEEILNGTLDPTRLYVEISIDGLNPGEHVYTLFVNDTSGNTVSDEVTVTVVGDIVAPTITYTPETVVYARGETGVVRNWTAVDDFKDNYTITVDGFLIESDDWTTEVISFDFSGLSEGVHYVTLTVYDIGGNSATSSVEVIVTAPLLTTVMLLAIAGVSAVLVVAIIVWYIRYR